MPAPAHAKPTVTNAHVGHKDALTRFVLDLTEGAAFQIFTLADPHRVVIELPAVRWGLNGETITVDRGLISYLRFGQFQPEVSRVVLDLTAQASVRRAVIVQPKGQEHYELIVDLEAAVTRSSGQAAPKTSAGEAQRVAAAPNSAGTAAPALEHSEANGKWQPPPPDLKRDLAPVQLAQSVVVPRPPPSRPRRPVIVIDAGHGGGDPGAVIGPKFFEKHITLKAAKELQKKLEATGRYDVVLTRTRDRFVSLRKRVAVAREARGSLFISLHADQHPNKKVRGAAVYTLSDKASDVEAAELARRENKENVVTDVDLTDGYDREVAQILISLVQQTTLNCSATFASLLVPELGRSGKLLGRTHRFAGFRVLKAPDIPSVLVELGYLSNKQDKARLSSAKHRAALMERIVAAIDSYFSERSC